MTNEFWTLVEDAYTKVLPVAPDSRKSVLEQVYSDRPDVVREVESLLKHEAAARKFDRSIVVTTAAEMLHETDSVIGTLVGGKYMVRERIGSGAMAEVYLADHVALKTAFALKRPLPGFGADPTYRSRFLEEARRAVLLKHENIARVHDVISEGADIFVVMEHVEGETLRARLKKMARPFTTSEFFPFALQCASALAAAHEKRIVHLDVKPENIMLTPAGQVKICDFGVARTLASPDASETTGEKPSEWTFAGTPSYMAPEVILNHEFDERADLFSLGTVFYEMLAARNPFLADTIIATTARVVSETPAPIENTDIDERLERIIFRLLSKEPGDRFATATELVDELKTFERSRYRWQDLRRSLGEAISERRSISVIAAVIVLSIAAIAVIAGEFGLLRPATSNEANTILVLPFDNLSQDAQNEYFTDGLTEELITSLSRNGARVLARDSSFRFKSRELDPVQIHNQYHVNYILRGSVRWSEDRLRMTVQVVHLPDGTTTAREYERNKGDVFALQDDLTASMTTELRPVLGLSLRTWHRGTQSQDVYELYLKGRYYWNKRDLESVLRAKALFEDAIRKDPQYAEAYVGLAECLNLLPGRVETPSAELLSKAQDSALMALRLAPQLSDAYSALGLIVQRKWDWKTAEAHFRHALELDPNSALGHQRLGGLMSNVGRTDIGVREYERARALDPLSIQLNSALGIIYYFDRRYDAAIAQLNRTLELDPGFARAYIFLGDSYIQKNMPDPALRAYQKGVELTNRDIRWVAALAYGYARAGLREQALQLLNGELYERIELKKEPVSSMYVAIAYAGLGENDKALDLLEKAFAAREPDMTEVKVYPALDGLRSNPRYQALLKGMGL